jgi:hypothetical protein
MNRLFSAFVAMCALLTAKDRLSAAVINVPNASFEGPVAFFPTPSINSWQKTPKPAWYDEGGGGFLWSQLTGTFKNPPPTSTNNHIVNCHGLQAIWLFAVPEVCLFQDYDSMDYNDPAPTHEFDATFEPGKSYHLTVGVIGTGGGMTNGVTLELSLYYRDANSNRIAVAVTSLTNTPSVFSNNTQLVDCHVNVPTVKTSDAWAGKKIGIQFRSTVTPELQGGYWDLDNVRLVAGPELQQATFTNGQFQAALLGETGARFEILTSTNNASFLTNWISLGIVTNQTRTVQFVDTQTGVPQRFYQARQLP